MARGQIQPGARIGGRFLIEGMIGGGGMARVYRARDLEYDRPAAVKVMRAQLARSAEFRQRFEREADVANRAAHPHILPVWDSGEDGANFYIATPLADTDLGGLIGEHGMDPGRAVAILRAVAWALDTAHGLGVVHRDVKPENILVVVNERGADHAWLSDFGIAKAATAATLTSDQAPLSVAYASPQQIRGSRKLDGRSDQYALACTLVDALTGRPPFDYESIQDVGAAHLDEQPPRVSDRRRDLPRELDAVVRRGMAKRPSDRFGSCQELMAAAARALGEPADERALTVRDHPPAPAATSADTVLATRVERPPAPAGPRRGALADDRLVGIALAAVALAVAVFLFPVPQIRTALDGPRVLSMDDCVNVEGQLPQPEPGAVTGVGELTPADCAEADARVEWHEAVAPGECGGAPFRGTYRDIGYCVAAN